MPENPYTYLGLCNDVLEAVNEVPFTDADFDDAIGLHKTVKNFINETISDIYAKPESEWPFQWTEGSITCVPGTFEYSTETSAMWIDWDSIYIDYDAAITEAPDHQELTNKSWEYYVDFLRESDINSEEVDQSRAKPQFVIRTRDDDKLVLSPVPDYAYTVKYPYFIVASTLSASTDVPAIPEEFKQVIKQGALAKVYEFRDDSTAHDRAMKRFDDYLGTMIRLLVPITDSIRFE